MAIAFDNANSIAGTAVSNVTTSAWTIAGSDRLLVGGMYWSASTPPAYTAVKWEGSAGAALTQVGSTLTVSAFARLALARLIAPNAASGTLYGEVSATADVLGVGGSSFTGAHQTTPLGTAATNSGNSASPATATVDVSSAADELVTAVSAGDRPIADSITIATGAGQTMRWENEVASSFTAGTQSTEPGAATVTMSEIYTSGGAVDWGIIGVSIKPAGDPPGVNAPKQRSRGFNLQQMADAEDEGRFNELDVRNWWCEAFA
jgi:hypothetical protein